MSNTPRTPSHREERPANTQRVLSGRYELGELIGRGGMADVFRGVDTRLGRTVAVKLLRPDLARDPQFQARFKREAQAVAALNHPSIVAVFDTGDHAVPGDHDDSVRVPYIVMEFVEGKTLYDMMVPPPHGDGHNFSEDETLDVIGQIADALAHSHARGLIHRDVKPKNIILTPGGVAKLTDLGLARAQDDSEAAASEAGKAYGTPYYISPEQIRGEVHIGPPADIYGLGATFYHMVTGRVPFEGKNPSAVMHQHLKAELVPPDHVNPKISNGTASVIEMMMAKNPAERYQNASDLLTDLELVAQGQPPHFAHKALDLSDVATAIAKEVPTQPVVVQTRKTAAAEAAGSPLMLVAFVMLGLSLLANLILIAMLAT